MIQLDDKQRCCQNCRFWQGNETKTWGQCHRYPPQFWSEGDSSGACHVGTDRDDWCGEHQPVEGWIHVNCFDADGKIAEMIKEIKTGIRVLNNDKINNKGSEQ